MYELFELSTQCPLHPLHPQNINPNPNSCLLWNRNIAINIL